MIILDSNIVIYSIQKGYQYLRDYLSDYHLAISKITIIEVLGYHHLTDPEKVGLSVLLDSFDQIPISDEIINRAVALRQQRKISLGDSIVAATSIESSAILITANVRDFSWIKDLEVYDPIIK